MRGFIVSNYQNETEPRCALMWIWNGTNVGSSSSAWWLLLLLLVVLWRRMMGANLISQFEQQTCWTAWRTEPNRKNINHFSWYNGLCVVHSWRTKNLATIFYPPRTVAIYILNHETSWRIKEGSFQLTTSGDFIEGYWNEFLLDRDANWLWVDLGLGVVLSHPSSILIICARGDGKINWY